MVGMFVVMARTDCYSASRRHD